MEKAIEVKDEIVEEKIEEKNETTEEKKDEHEESADLDLSSSKEEEIPLFLSDSEEPGNMPVSSHLKTKRKLKGVISEKDGEIEELKQKIESLSSTPPPNDSQPSKRPRERDFETDEEYDDAIDKWDEQRLANISSNLTQSNTQRTNQEQLQQNIGKAVDSHYIRAEELVKQHHIDPEVYKTADSNVRKAVEAIIPNGGDQVVDALISKLGDDSEKVLFYLGRNKAKLNEFQSVLVNDPLGLEAAVLLGELKQTIKTNTKRTSQAPPPAANVSGDATSKAKGDVEKRKYIEAHKKKDGQSAYNIKRDAKKAGIDTENWR